MKINKAFVIICVTVVLGYVSIVSMESWGVVGAFATLCGLYILLAIDMVQDLKKERLKEIRHMRHMREKLKRARTAAENRQATMNSFIKNVRAKEVCVDEKRALYNKDDFVVEM